MSERKTFFIQGWIGQSEVKALRSARCVTAVDAVSFPSVWPKRGKKDHWFSSEWPPVKVKLTLEILE